MKLDKDTQRLWYACKCIRVLESRISRDINGMRREQNEHRCEFYKRRIAKHFVEMLEELLAKNPKGCVYVAEEDAYVSTKTIMLDVRKHAPWLEDK